ncbi:dephospho-CoA kinase [Mycoplasma testudineum]|uniref:Dephospho-CoA kinase n=1 Tax=Mycoplasma testudineum TaxID=244584 RepID=A0A4R6ICE2_9MOLU|nr:dephospho-CoA kinase [Mycoplasma testudineum]OYD26784.1 dephospho-CoA kinase [Mycoplasma testudineum]TDO19920.1 dephospho-CoA kinase [Mycoplasma testudineum]
MIAITGRTHSGKTFLLKQLSNLGYKTLSADDFFHEQYKKDQAGYKLILSFLGPQFVKSDEVNRSAIKEWLKSDENNINILNKLTHKLLFEHLIKQKYDFVEIPIINSEFYDFLSLFDRVINLEISNQQRQKFINNRNVDKSTIELIDRLNKGFYGPKSVNISFEERQKPNFLEDFLTLVKH